jgi:hypothetical protein
MPTPRSKNLKRKLEAPSSSATTTAASVEEPASKVPATESKAAEKKEVNGTATMAEQRFETLQLHAG